MTGFINGILEASREMYERSSVVRAEFAEKPHLYTIVDIKQNLCEPQDFFDALKKSGISTKHLDFCKDQIIKTQTDERQAITWIRANEIAGREDPTLEEILTGARKRGYVEIPLDLAIQIRLHIKESWGSCCYVGMKPLILKFDGKESRCIVQMGRDDAGKWVKLVDVSSETRFKENSGWFFVVPKELNF